jgi:hypothetical protein
METKGYRFDFAACKPHGATYGLRLWIYNENKPSIKKLVELHAGDRVSHLTSVYAFSCLFPLHYGGKGCWYRTYLFDVVKPPYNPKR